MTVIDDRHQYLIESYVTKVLMEAMALTHTIRRVTRDLARPTPLLYGRCNSRQPSAPGDVGRVCVPNN